MSTIFKVEVHGSQITTRPLSEVCFREIQVRTTPSMLSKQRKCSHWTNPFTGRLPLCLPFTKATAFEDGDAQLKLVGSSAATWTISLASIPSQRGSLRGKARSRPSRRVRRTVPRAWLVCSFLHPFIHHKFLRFSLVLGKNMQP